MERIGIDEELTREVNQAARRLKQAKVLPRLYSIEEMLWEKGFLVEFVVGQDGHLYVKRVGGQHEDSANQ